MFEHKFDDQVKLKIYFDWFILSFLAGHINAGGYLACHRFVSHVTGFATLAGISFQQMQWAELLTALCIPIFFIIGVMISGYLTQTKNQSKPDSQKYAPIMDIMAAVLIFVTAAGHWGFFGVFGGESDAKNDFILLACLCGACGLQNGAITLASGATIRTTHLTGITTDLGLGLIRAEHKANLLRLTTILFFTLGSAIGAFTYTTFQYSGFLFPAFIALYFSFTARYRI